MPTTLYLASTSPARLATLRAVGIEPIAIAPGVDEEAAVDAAGPLAPADTVQLLARLKAEAIVGDPRVIDGIIVGGDSVFEFGGVVYGKPHEPSVARERWLRQRGGTGVLHSGHHVIRVKDSRPIAASGAPSSATVTFASDFDDAELDAYIATGEPLEVAGAFTIDSKGAPFITRVDGDPHTVVGISIPTLRTLVRSLGVEWTDLWNR